MTFSVKIWLLVGGLVETVMQLGKFVLIVSAQVNIHVLCSSFDRFLGLFMISFSSNSTLMILKWVGQYKQNGLCSAHLHI